MVQFFHKILDVYDQIFDYWEIGERFNLDLFALEFMQEAGTGKLRLAVNICSTAAADAHAARPPVRECPVNVILDIIQRVKNDHVPSVRNLVLLDVGFSLNLRSIPEYL